MFVFFIKQQAWVERSEKSYPQVIHSSPNENDYHLQLKFG